MTQRSRRFPIIVLVVAVLVAVVALVAHGRPLAAHAGPHGGLSPAFWQYTATSLVIVAVLLCAGTIYVVSQYRVDPRKEDRPRRNHALLTILGLLAFGIGFRYVWYVLLHHGHGSTSPEGGGGGTNLGGHHGKQTHSSHPAWFRWDELAIVLGLLLVVAVVLAANRKRGASGAAPALPPEAVAAALDESLEDLRADPDLRRAIIAAYARMERALAASGVPRRPSEAPLEYLERALLGLHTSAPAVRRLTDLFEWARFSHHEPDAAMRDDAVDALEAVRDELRAPDTVAA